MGNRAVITFDEKPSETSIGIYLHWNGGPESVLALLEAAERLGVREYESDPTYCIARLCQVAGNWFGGSTSVGVGILDNLDTHNGDNGVYQAGRKDGKITLLQSENGENGWRDLNIDEIKKHTYWEKDQIVLDIMAKNKLAFAEKD